MERIQRTKHLFALAAGIGCLLAAFQVNAQTATYPLSPAQSASLDTDFQAMMRRVGNNDVTVRPDGKMWVRDIAKPVRMPSGATIGIAAGTQVAKKATAAAFAKGALRVAGRAMGYVGLALTAYDLYKMLENNDVGLSVIPDTGYILQNKPGSLDGFTWTLQGWSASSPYGYASPMDACDWLVRVYMNKVVHSISGPNTTSPQYMCYYVGPTGAKAGGYGIYKTARSDFVAPKEPASQSTLEKFYNDHPELMNTEAVKNAVRDGVLEALKDKTDFENLPDVITLPDGTKLQPNTKTKVDTKVETKTVERNGVKERITTTTETIAELGPDGKVKFTTDTTEVVQPLDEAGLPTGNPTSTTTSTAPAPDKEPPGLCDLFPDILACKKLDEAPEEPIQKETKTVELQEANLGFGGGRCPADVTTKIGHMNLKIIDVQQGCSWIVSYAKPLILLLSSFISMMIIFAGVTKTEL